MCVCVYNTPLTKKAVSGLQSNTSRDDISLVERVLKVRSGIRPRLTTTYLVVLVLPEE